MIDVDVEDIKRWANNGEGHTHMIVVCDHYGYYPVYVSESEDVDEQVTAYKRESMKRVTAVYDLGMDIDTQHKVN